MSHFRHGIACFGNVSSSRLEYRHCLIFFFLHVQLRTMKLEGSWTRVNTRPTWQAKMSHLRNGGGHQLQDGTLLMIHAAACGQKTVRALCLLKFQRTFLRVRLHNNSVDFSNLKPCCLENGSYIYAVVVLQTLELHFRRHLMETTSLQETSESNNILLCYVSSGFMVFCWYVQCCQCGSTGKG